MLEEENALFSGDNVLGVGTTVIPSHGGDLLDYMASLERMLALAPSRIYPAHGPRIADAPAKLREYIAHRNAREAQILAALAQGDADVATIVKRVYTDVPEVLHAAAGHSVAAHLRKLEREGRARRRDDARAARSDLVARLSHPLLAQLRSADAAERAAACRASRAIPPARCSRTP